LLRDVADAPADVERRLPDRPDLTPHPRGRSVRRQGSGFRRNPFSPEELFVTKLTYPAVIDRVIDAINAKDEDTYAAAFAPDAVIEDFGRSFSGPGGALAWSSTDLIGADMFIERRGITANPDGSFSVAIHARSRGFNGDGGMHFTVVEDRVIRLWVS
jgi:hypothetical protein